VAFDKTFLFEGKSIRKEKGTVKEKNKAKGKGTKEDCALQIDYRL